MASKGGTKRKRQRIPAVVPRIVFGTAFIGVIPACVVAACTGGSDSGTVSSSSSGTGSSSGAMGVAAVAYQCFDANDPNCFQGVAAVAYQCFDGSTDPNCNFAVADAAFGDGASDADAADG